MIPDWHCFQTPISLFLGIRSAHYFAHLPPPLLLGSSHSSICVCILFVLQCEGCCWVMCCRLLLPQLQAAGKSNDCRQILINFEAMMMKWDCRAFWVSMQTNQREKQWFCTILFSEHAAATAAFVASTSIYYTCPVRIRMCPINPF